MTTAQIAQLAQNPNYVTPVTARQLGAQCAIEGETFCPEAFYVPGTSNYYRFIAGFQSVRPKILEEVAI